MAVCNLAEWRGSPNNTPNGMNRYMGMVLHIMQGSLLGTDSWFKNKESRASAHFGIGKNGRIFQWVDTKDKAWAQSAGNPSWLSIELDGFFGNSPTTEQRIAVSRLYAWSVRTHAIPVQKSERPAMPGLGYHAMGGSAWGSHPCPGKPIVDARDGILSLVHTMLRPEEVVRPMFTPAIALEPIVAELPCPTGGVWLLAASGAIYGFGGAPYYGGAHHQPYFAGKKAARLEPGVDGGAYVIISTDGGRYNYGPTQR